MVSSVKKNFQLNKETWSFFSRILKPNTLEAIDSLEKLINFPKDDHLHFLWNVFSENNINCFKLMGKSKNIPWEFYYADLETPILFYPVFKKEISFDIHHQLSTLLKNIKSNLLILYGQEIESFYIWVKSEGIPPKFSLYTFKPDNQKVEYNLRQFTKKSEVETNHTRNLDEYFIKKGSIDDIRSKTGRRKELSVDKGDCSNQIKRIIHLQNAKKRMPIGRRSPKNRLNLLTGREWIKFSKSWFIHHPPSRKKEEFLHPGKFPETLIRKFITFFTKPGELILDPFLGSGSTLIAAKMSNRSGVGIELSPEYARVSESRIANLEILAYPPLYQTDKSIFLKVICGDSYEILEFWKKYDLPAVDFCITSPPYWNQLERNNIRQKKRKDLGLDTKYSENSPRDLGNLKDYKVFLNEQKIIFNNVYKILKPKGYLVIISNNVFANGKVYPLAYDTALSLTRNDEDLWILKDEKIWLQDDKSLLALGVNYAWVGNRCHQYCYIFRKEGI
ncbi:MAG: DNA methyltransferase [Candidatus Hodarchaeales archaeon]|jgi:DNA modification methylase